MKGKEVIIFDIDGTLIRSPPEYIHYVVGRALEDLGTSVPTKYIDKFWFEPDRNDIIDRYFKVDVRDFWKLYRNYDTAEERRNVVHPYEDVIALNELNKTYRLAAVSGARPEVVKFQATLVGDYFEEVISCHQFSEYKPKPDPSSILHCMNILNVKPEKTIYVGNGIEDVLAAQRANVLDIMIDRGEYKFNNINPTITIKSLFELLS